MITAEFQGFVNNAKVRSNSNRSWNTYSVRTTTTKDKSTGEWKSVYVNCTDFGPRGENSPTKPPADGSFVKVSGLLDVREYEKDGQKRWSLDLIVSNVEVMPPKDGAKPAKKEAGEKEWYEE